MEARVHVQNKAMDRRRAGDRQDYGPYLMQRGRGRDV